MKETIHTLSARLPRHLIHILIIAALLMPVPFSNAFAQNSTSTEEEEYEVPEAPDEVMPAPIADVTQKQSNKLWVAYNTWVHRVMVCLADDDPSALSIKRLLKHEDAVDDIMDSWYSDYFGKKLSELLYAHKAIAAEMRRAAKAGDDNANAEAYEQLLLNKSEVIEFMRQASPLYTVARSEGRH